MEKLLEEMEKSVGLFLNAADEFVRKQKEIAIKRKDDEPSK
jgi:hypothetical protein